MVFYNIEVLTSLGISTTTTIIPDRSLLLYTANPDANLVLLRIVSVMSVTAMPISGLILRFIEQKNGQYTRVDHFIIGNWRSQNISEEQDAARLDQMWEPTFFGQTLMTATATS